MADKSPRQRSTWLRKYLLKLIPSLARPRNPYVEPAAGSAVCISSDGRLGDAPASTEIRDDVCILLCVEREALEHHRATLKPMGHILLSRNNRIASHAPYEE